MKKILISMLMVLVLVSCSREVSKPKPVTTAPESPSEAPVETEEPETIEAVTEEAEVEDLGRVSDYVLTKENTTLLYDGDHEQAYLKKWLEYKEGARIQLASESHAVFLTEVLELQDDGVRVIYQEPTEVGHFMVLEVDEEEKAYDLLVGPLEVGTTWESFNETYEITGVHLEVQVPAGTFKTIEVTSEGVTSYYAKEVGLIKRVVDLDGFGFTQELQEMIEEPKDFALELWTLAEDGMTLTSKPMPFTMKTGELLRDKFAEIFIEEGLFPEETTIHSLYVNETDGELYLDVSSEIYNTNMGAMAESNMVHAVVNTLTGYFGKERLYFWVDGENYMSGHLLFEREEPIQRLIEN